MDAVAQPRAVLAGGGNQPIKCGAIGCRMPKAILQDCAGAGCTKRVHEECYERAILMKFKVDKLMDPHKKCTLYVCSKTCYNKVEKNIVLQPARIPWDKDGRNGPDDPINSQSILMQWMLTEGNYNRFRGHDNGGKRKLAFGVELSERMQAQGCRAERSGEAVVKKIQEIESKFIKAHDWVNNTGQGVKERDGMETFEGCVRQRCKWYFELEPIMADRSKARAKVTTETLRVDDVSVLSMEDSTKTGPNPSPTDSAMCAAAEAAESSLANSMPTRTSVSSSVGSKKVLSSAKKRKKHEDIEEQEQQLIQSIIARNQRRVETNEGGMTEKERHNRRMEEIEQEKIKWQSKTEELQYKRQLFSTKKELESAGHTPEEIVEFFPELQRFYKK